MTAVLSWHVQIFVVIWGPAMELQQGEVSIELELLAKKSSVKYIRIYDILYCHNTAIDP